MGYIPTYVKSQFLNSSHNSGERRADDLQKIGNDGGAVSKQYSTLQVTGDR